MEDSLQSSLNTNDKARILLVDDQEPFLKLFKRFFKSTDYQVEATTSPDKALEMILQGEDFDLAVLDVMMPSMNGFELCKAIRQKYSHLELPVLFLTARREHESIVEGFASGGNDFVSKPFEAPELISRTQTLVRLKKLYETNKILHNELIERNKFLQMNIHDLKSPLTSIMMLAGIVQKDIQESDEENKKNLDVVINSADQMVNLVNQMLEYNNLENKNITLEFSKTSVHDIMAQVLDVFKPLAMKKSQDIVLRKEISSNVQIDVDGEKVVRAMSNILGNAIKFTPQSKSISAAILPIHCECGDFVRMEIADEGPGFSDVEKNILFKQFGSFSSKPTGGESSTGLGLMIAKQLIELNNGKIWLDSEYSNGSKFIIEFPLAKNN